MKKTVFSLLVVLATLFSANAQFYAGGSLGITSSSNANPKSAFEISPEVGYYINEKFDIGLGLGFSKQKTQNDYEYTSWSVAPYARYSFYQLKNFEVIGKGSVAFSGTGNSGTTIGVNISPILAYNLTEKIVLFTNLNCFSLNFTSFSPDSGESSSHFSFSTSTRGLLNTSNLPIGLIYKF